MHNDPLNVVPGFLWKYSEIEQQCYEKGTTYVSCDIVHQEGRIAAVFCRFSGIGNKNFRAKLLLAPVGAPRGLLEDFSVFEINLGMR